MTSHSPGSLRCGLIASLTGLALICGPLATTAGGAPLPPTAGPSPAAAGVPAADDAGPGFTAVDNDRGSAGRRLTAGSASKARAHAAVGVTGSLTPLPGECPIGMRRGNTLYADGFEKGDLPEPTLSLGFTVGSDGAASGATYARSVLSATTQPAPDKPYHALFFPLVTSRVGHTVLSLKIKGDYPADTAYVAVNEDSGWVDPSPAWDTVTLDITAAAAASTAGRAAGEMDIRVLNYPASISGTTTVAIDDVVVYQCTPVPATGVRGDFTGDRIPDLLSVDTQGLLFVTPGARTGVFGRPLRIGSGWNRMTWLGSPGDVTGDLRPDVLARRDDGRLFLYAGHGMGAFARGRQIGVGWNTMSAMLTPGDMTNDGLSELIGRDRAGGLYRYSFTRGGGALVAKTVIGSGFGVFTRLISPGDISRDRRGDVLGVLKSGVMYAYHATAKGTLGRGAPVSQNWQQFGTIAGPGDLNGDGRGDVVARGADGTLWTLLSLSGQVAATRAATGFGVYRLFA